MKNEIIHTKLLSKKEIAKDIFEFVVDANNHLNKSKAGQFIHISCGEATYLRRPISICEIIDNKLRFIFEVKGKGTLALSKACVGDTLNILGPLGMGWTIDNDRFKNVVVVGGGLGTYPLIELAKHTNAIAILGYRTKNVVTLEDDFNKYCTSVLITTDDGSYKTKGLVTTKLIELLENNKIDAIYSCGPLPMLRAVKKIAMDNNIYCEISLEERMACGIGACLCCVTKVKDETLETGFTYSHICAKGPVFKAEEVILDD